MPEPASPPGPGVAAAAVDDQLFRALVVFRVVSLLFMLGINAARWDDFARAELAWAVVGGIVVWSGVVTWAYSSRERRTVGWLVADLLVTVAAMWATYWVLAVDTRAEHAATLPTYWAATVVLAWAVRFGTVGGVAAAAVVAVSDVLLRVTVTSSTIGNVFLLLLAALTVGYCTALVRDAAEQRALADRRAAAALERERLGRVVHDGALQALAMVQRRGAELGGEMAELGRLAGQQESALRAYVQRPIADDPPGEGHLDLAGALSLLSSSHVSVAVPGHPVLLPEHGTRELLAVVAACLDNVSSHVGPHAPAWVLLEERASEIVVSVRDEGPGIPAGRLQAAAEAGRMGVRTSIQGRVRDLGGRADLMTAPDAGTEWEFTVPFQR